MIKSLCVSLSVIIVLGLSVRVSAEDRATCMKYCNQVLDDCVRNQCGSGDPNRDVQCVKGCGEKARQCVSGCPNASLQTPSDVVIAGTSAEGNCLIGVDARSQRSPEFVSVDEQPNHANRATSPWLFRAFGEPELIPLPARYPAQGAEL
jgi:hypothetical protein